MDQVLFDGFGNEFLEFNTGPSSRHLGALV
jgi:hypothetical protein